MEKKLNITLEQIKKDTRRIALSFMIPFRGLNFNKECHIHESYTPKKYYGILNYIKNLDK